MINYDDTLRTVFRTISGSGSHILNHIKGISINVNMPSISSSTNRCMRAWVSGVDVHNDSVNISVNLDIPIVGISKEIIVYNGMYMDGDISIFIDYDDIPSGSYTVTADILLRNILVTTSKSLILFGAHSDDGIKLRNGYNVKIGYSDNTLSITGGPGLGKGTYDGTVNDNTKGKYSGLRSINGIRSDRNINIKMSDLIISNGGGVR